MADTTAIDKVLLDAAVVLVRRVPWGPTRAELEATAAALRSEASYEAGMADNFYTAGLLREKAFLHEFAAQARFPRPGDVLIGKTKAKLKDRLLDLVEKRDDGVDEYGDPIPLPRDELRYAVSAVLDAAPDCVDDVIDEFFAAGRIEDAADCKSIYRGEFSVSPTL